MKQLPLKVFHNITFTPGPWDVSNFCWVWGGAKTPDGYGLVRLGVMQYVHRVVYESLVGPIPKGWTMVNSCGERACCSPRHWKPFTRADAAKLRAQWEAERLKDLAISDDDYVL